jgi:hypothetical protein
MRSSGNDRVETADSKGSDADALAGLRVLNLSPSLGGAFVGQFFADFGAEVVLVEPAGGGPLRREAGWPIWSRGSKSLEASLDDPAVQGLARRADLVIDTFRPGVLERHDLGHDQLAAENPRLVTTAITAFGRNGPMAKLKGYEGVVMAKIGAYDQFSALLTRPGPGFATVPYCTASAAQLAISGALVALYEREKSGVGQRVDTTLLQAIAAHDTWNWMVAHWGRKYPEAFKTAPVVDPSRRVPNSWLSYGLLQGLSKDGRWMQFSQATPGRIPISTGASPSGSGCWARCGPRPSPSGRRRSTPTPTSSPRCSARGPSCCAIRRSSMTDRRRSPRSPGSARSASPSPSCGWEGRRARRCARRRRCARERGRPNRPRPDPVRPGCRWRA